jgi:hypothetical protein
MTFTVEIPLRLDVRLAHPDAISSAQGIFTEEMRAAVTDIVQHVQARVMLNIEKDDLIFTSQLLNSIATAVGLHGLVITGAVGTNVKHGKYQELGTVPHFVPFNLAPSLYEEMQSKFGWVKPDMRLKSNRTLKAPNPAAKTGPHGMSTIKGKTSTYLVENPDRLYLQKDRDSKPIWGVWVSGRKRPFLYPGWEESLGFIEQRLMLGAQRAAERINAGGT